MKFTRNVDGVSNLESVVMHDLREIGVKIPKTRKQISSVVSVSKSLYRIAFIYRTYAGCIIVMCSTISECEYLNNSCTCMASVYRYCGRRQGSLQ